MITGTAHFEDKMSAIYYYGTQCYPNAAEAVEQKLNDGEIFIGRPELKEGEKLLLNSVEGRYMIES